MVQLAEYLDWLNVVWFHCPNEGRRDIRTAVNLKRMGLKAGVPDILILHRVPGNPNIRGIAIEMKREKGGVVSLAQAQFMAKLNEQGWATHVAKGFEDAVAFLRRIGLVR
jgi:hypothetical protein